MAGYRGRRTGTVIPVDVTVGQGRDGTVDIGIHFMNTWSALVLTNSEALELAMLLLKHAGKPGTVVGGGSKAA